MPVWLQATLWGLVAGSALVVGAALGDLASIPTRLVAAVTAFGGGVLIAILAFNLMDEAYKTGGFYSTAVGFLAGSVFFTIANLVLSRHGAKHRKRSGEKQVKESHEKSGSGIATAIGSLMDDSPESIVMGISLIGGAAVSWVAVVGIFLSNIPEALSSSTAMKKSGRSAGYVFGLWEAIALVTGIAALIGYAVFSRFSEGVIAATTAVAAGAILTMLADTMIPEAFEEMHDFSGLIAVVGFLIFFVLSKSA